VWVQVGTGIEDYFNSGFAFSFFGKIFHNDLSGLTHVHGSTGRGMDNPRPDWCLASLDGLPPPPYCDCDTLSVCVCACVRGESEHTVGLLERVCGLILTSRWSAYRYWDRDPMTFTDGRFALVWRNGESPGPGLSCRPAGRAGDRGSPTVVDSYYHLRNISMSSKSLAGLRSTFCHTDADTDDTVQVLMGVHVEEAGCGCGCWYHG
jgi:hypothetical protein